MLDKLKIRLDIKDDSKDNLLLLILDEAECDILDYTNRNELLPRMQGLLRELAIIRYNIMGSEGESSRSEGGVSVSYSRELPEQLKSRLKAYRRLKAVSIIENKK